jgi:predicted O-methyltransferase YrrM
MLRKLVNIGSNSLKRRNFGVMAGKVAVRLKERRESQKSRAVKLWCARHAERYEDYARTLDAALWQETQSVCAQIEKDAQAKLDSLGLDLGGGGHYPLLYFFARYLKARNVIETGVAAGWSSYALLLALEKNGNDAKLYSSDFPYFRYKNPEKLVGYVVEDRLKKDWRLFIDGDRNNLLQILAETGPVDLFHYDSDKSIEGRRYALAAVRPHLSEHAVVMFDDIQDNDHFMRLVGDEQLPFRVFGFGGKYIGVIDRMPHL